MFLHPENHMKQNFKRYDDRAVLFNRGSPRARGFGHIHLSVLDRLIKKWLC